MTTELWGWQFFSEEQLRIMISGERESWARFYANCPNFSNSLWSIWCYSFLLCCVVVLLVLLSSPFLYFVVLAATNKDVLHIFLGLTWFLQAPWHQYEFMLKLIFYSEKLENTFQLIFHFLGDGKKHFSKCKQLPKH